MQVFTRTCWEGEVGGYGLDQAFPMALQFRGWCRLRTSLGCLAEAGAAYAIGQDNGMTIRPCSASFKLSAKPALGCNRDDRNRLPHLSAADLRVPRDVCRVLPVASDNSDDVLTWSCESIST